MLRLLSNIYNNRYAMFNQLYVNIRTTVATTRLGVFWWILDPLLLMLIYYFVVSVIFKRGGPNFHIFSLCGIVTWQSFSRSTVLASSSLVRNASLIKQVPLPMELYVLVSPLVQAFFYTIGLLIVLFWNNDAISLHSLAIFIPVLAVVLLSFALGLYLSILNVLVRDTTKFLNYILRFGFYFSPVLYSPDRVYSSSSIPEVIKSFYALNPMVHVITAVRDLLYTGQMFDMMPVGVTMLSALVAIQLGLYFFRRLSPVVPKRV